MATESMAFLSLEKSTEGNVLSFLVPSTFVLPPRFYTMTPPDLMTALLLTERLLEQQATLSLEEHDSKQVLAQRQQHQKELAGLQRQEQELRQQLERQHAQEIRNWDEQKKLLGKQIAELETSLQRASASYDSLRTQFQDEADRRVAQKETDLQRLIDHLRKELDLERADRKEREGKLLALQTVHQNSSKKGREGEQQFETLCSDLMGWTLTYSGKTGHAADYVAQMHGLQVRFEVKKYNYTVPTKEMEKFRRDLQEHPETDVGVFLSMETLLTGMQDVQVEFTPTHQVVFWIPKFLHTEMALVLNWVDCCIQLTKPYRKLLQQQNQGDEHSRLKEIVQRVILACQSTIGHATEQQRALEVDRRGLQDRLDTLIKNQTLFLTTHTKEVQMMLSLLTGQEAAAPVEQTAVVDKPKRAPRNKKGSTPLTS